MSNLLDALKKAAEERANRKKASASTNVYEASSSIKKDDEKKIPEHDNSKEFVNDSNIHNNSLPKDLIFKGENIAHKHSDQEEDISSLENFDLFEPFLETKELEENLEAKEVLNSKKNLYDFNLSNNYRVFISIVFIPVLFFIIVFYSSVKWFSILEKDFDKELNIYNLGFLIKRFNDNVSKDLKNNHEATEELEQGLDSVATSKDIDLSNSEKNKTLLNSHEKEIANDLSKKNTKFNLLSDNARLHHKQNKKLFSASEIKNNKSYVALKDKKEELIFSDSTKIQYLFESGNFASVVHIVENDKSLNLTPDIYEIYVASKYKLSGPSVLSELIKKGLSDGLITNPVATLYFLSDQKFLDKNIVLKLNKIFPENPYGYISLASFYILNDKKYALDILLKGLEYSNNYYLYLNIAKLYKQIGDLYNYQKYLSLAMRYENE